MSQELWCLYCHETKQELEGLALSELQAAVTVIPRDKYKYWQAWREGWSNWIFISEIDELKFPFEGRLRLVPPPISSVVPSKNGVGAVANSSSTKRSAKGEKTKKMSPEWMVKGHDVFDKKPNSEVKFNSNATVIEMTEHSEEEHSVSHGKHVPRNFERFKKSYTVTIYNEKEKFETQCVDVSVGGLRLKDPIPQNFIGSFKVKIVKSPTEKPLTLLATRVPKSNDRTRLIILPLRSKADEISLNNWLKGA